MSALKLLKNPEFHQRTKHIDIRYQMCRDYVQKGLVNVKHVASKEQIADIMTKPLTKEIFEYLRDKLNLCYID
ncbi:hypothetical protein TKK_0012110 [Trichogramma kaykai]